MQTSPEIDFQNITILLQKYHMDTHANIVRVVSNIEQTVSSGLYKTNPEVQKIFEETRQSGNIQKLNNLYQITSFFDSLMYNWNKKTPVISIFQENIPKLLDFLSWVWNWVILDSIKYFIEWFENIFQEIFSFPEIQRLILPSDSYEDIKIKLTQDFWNSWDKNIQKLLSLLESLEKVIQDTFLGINNNNNPNQTTFSFLIFEKIINQYKKIQWNIKLEKALKFYISLWELAINYFWQKLKDEKLWVNKEVIWNMIFQYSNSSINPNLLDLEWFLGVVVYAFWDWTNKLWLNFIEQIEKIYKKNYIQDPQKLERLLSTFRSFIFEKKQADFYMIGVNDFHFNSQKTFLEKPENIVSSFRFNEYKWTPWKKAEYIWAMNIDPEFQWYGVQWLMNQILYKRFHWVFMKEKSKIIMPENTSWIQDVWNIEKVDEFYAHVIADTPVERLWKKMGFVATGNDEEIIEDGKKVIRIEIVLTKESFLQRYK